MGGMDDTLAQELALNDGVIIVARLPASIPRWAIFNAVRAGRLVRVHSGVYCEPGARVDPFRIAAAYADGRAAFSHTTALAIWGIRATQTGDLVHLTVPRGVHLRSTHSAVVHVRNGFRLEPPMVLHRGEHMVTALDDSIVDAWTLLQPNDRVAVVLRATTSRMTVPSRLATALQRAPRLPGRRDLLELIDKLAQGCQSYLEIFGLERVFVGPGLPVFERQVPVRVGGRAYYLDVFAEHERVAFELDGDAWHSSSGQREADMRRDAALASAGILVVRFSYRRLVSEPERVRQEIKAILDSRRGHDPDTK